METYNDIVELGFLYFKTFLTLVDERSYSKAAIKLAISQSAISQKISVIEKHLGMKLIDRTAGKHVLMLTPAGEQFYQHCQSLCKLTENIAEEMQNLKEGSSGILRLSVSPSRVQDINQNYAMPFYLAHPNVSFEILEDTMRTLEKNVSDGLTELAFSNTPLRNPQNFDILHRTKEKVYAIISQDSKIPFPDKESLDWADLCNLPISVSKGSSILFLEIMARAGFKPQIVAYNTSRSMALTWARKGVAIALIPIEAHAEKDPTLRYIPINDEKLYTEKILYKLADKPLSPLAQKFLDFYLQHIEQA